MLKSKEIQDKIKDIIQKMGVLRNKLPELQSELKKAVQNEANIRLVENEKQKDEILKSKKEPVESF